MTSPRTPLPADVLAGAVQRAPAAPLITHYDDATGERIELSASTLANWVAKTSNLLQNEFDVGPGTSIVLALPVHWQTAIVLLATWSCGAAVVDAAAVDHDRFPPVDVFLTAQDRLDDIEVPEGAELIGLSLNPLGMGMAGYDGPARDFAVEVRTQGDVFVPNEVPEADSLGLRIGELELTLAGLTGAARELGGRLGLAAEDRVLVDERTATDAGPVAWLLTPLVAGASIVLYRNPVEDRLVRRAAEERVTATLGRRIEGVRELGRPG